MKTFVLISGGRVAELLTETVEIDGVTYDLTDRFPAEMVAACVALTATQAKRVRVGWTYDGSTFTAPAGAPDSVISRIITPRAFRLRFTGEEKAALTLAASKGLEAGDASLQVFLDDLSASQEVDLDHPELRAGMDAVVAAKLMTKARAAEILAA